MYLLVNSYSPHFEMFSDYRYRHMYIDFRTVPPLLNHEIIDVDLGEDAFLLYLLKAVQTLIQENIRKNGREKIQLPKDEDISNQIKRLLKVILTRLQEQYHLSAMNNAKIEAAIRYINEHYAERIRNEDIAATLHIDKRSLIRLFNKYMNMSPCQYLTQHRVECAIEHLRNGKNVTETAFLCGYQSEASLRSAFKKVMGCSPTAILKQ